MKCSIFLYETCYPVLHIITYQNGFYILLNTGTKWNLCQTVSLLQQKFFSHDCLKILKISLNARTVFSRSANLLIQPTYISAFCMQTIAQANLCNSPPDRSSTFLSLTCIKSVTTYTVFITHFQSLLTLIKTWTKALKFHLFCSENLTQVLSADHFLNCLLKQVNL